MTTVIVAFAHLEDAMKLRSVLLRHGYTSVIACNTGAKAINECDRMGGGIVICGYKMMDMMYTELQEGLPKGSDLLLMASRNILAQLDTRHLMTLELPIKPQEFVETLQFMSQALVRKRKKEENRCRTPEDLQMIADAKYILMMKYNMTEEEAHRFLQKDSMNAGMSLSQRAKWLIQEEKTNEN